MNELEKTSPDAQVFKIVGPILIAVSKDQAVQELKERKEIAELHIKTLARQETLVRKQIEELRKKISDELAKLRGGATPSTGA